MAKKKTTTKPSSAPSGPNYDEFLLGMKPPIDGRSPTDILLGRPGSAATVRGVEVGASTGMPKTVEAGTPNFRFMNPPEPMPRDIFNPPVSQGQFDAALKHETGITPENLGPNMLMGTAGLTNLTGARLMGTGEMPDDIILGGALDFMGLGEDNLPAEDELEARSGGSSGWALAAAAVALAAWGYLKKSPAKEKKASGLWRRAMTKMGFKMEGEAAEAALKTGAKEVAERQLLKDAAGAGKPAGWLSGKSLAKKGGIGVGLAGLATAVSPWLAGRAYDTKQIVTGGLTREEAAAKEQSDLAKSVANMEMRARAMEITNETNKNREMNRMRILDQLVGVQGAAADARAANEMNYLQARRQAAGQAYQDLQALMGYAGGGGR